MTWDRQAAMLGLITGLVLAAVLVAVALLRGQGDPEVTLDPVNVERADPLPCEDDPDVRQLYQELGVLCRGDI